MIVHKYRLRPDLKLSSESVFLRDTGVQFHREAAAFSKRWSPPVRSLVLGFVRHTTLCTDLRSQTPSYTVSTHICIRDQCHLGLYIPTLLFYIQQVW